MKRFSIGTAFWLAFAVFFGSTTFESAAQTPAAASGPTYKTGYSLMLRLGADIRSQLPKDIREQISSQPVSIETDLKPFVRLLFYPDEPKPIRGVWVSAGFVDLVNRLAHASAIDKKKKGYFKAYISEMAQFSGDDGVPPLPDEQNPAFWTDDILNDQQSNFNCIVGIVVGIKLSHHYLGHFEKYKDKLEDEKGNAVTPINNLLTDKEWDDAFDKGVASAVNAGCTVEGVIPFFEAFDQMTPRPQWVSFFIPQNAKLPKIKKTLMAIQKKVMHGS